MRAWYIMDLDDARVRGFQKVTAMLDI